MTLCTVEGCGRTANRVGARLCEAHYMRVRRHGSTERRSKVKAGALEHSGGYLLDYAPCHPLSRGKARVYQHRAVFYAQHGDGPFECHWCNKVVGWSDMHVDHLNDDKQDNRIENLVASCPICNQKRGQQKMIASHRRRSGIEFGGMKLTPNEWARRLGISRASLLWRLSNGWDLARALSEPRGVHGPASRPAQAGGG